MRAIEFLGLSHNRLGPSFHPVSIFAFTEPVYIFCHGIDTSDTWINFLLKRSCSSAQRFLDRFHRTLSFTNRLLHHAVGRIIF